MRSVSIAIRDVRRKGFVFHLRFPPPSRYSLIYRRDLRLSALGYEKYDRYYFSTTSLNWSGNPADLLISGLSDNGQTAQKAPVQQQNSDLPLVRETKLFSKWMPVLTDSFRLSVESDFYRRGPAKGWRSQLLVDQFENRKDLALWCCLLDYQKRVNGDDGVQAVWKGLWGRKTLYDVQSPLATFFWQTILEAAVKSDDDRFLETIWIYSEWMYDRHGVKWPQLYSTVMSHLLRTHQHQQALQWQLRLMPNFYPGAKEFASMIKQFADDRELYRIPTLESLYVANHEHQLYDILVPYLYNMGESQLAMKWRGICLRHDDTPLAPVPVQPFLRFLQGYYPHKSLHVKESAAVSELESTEDDAERIELSREFINRVHGGTFGISVKNYNDQLGAKWLASSWVSLNLAISTISALGIEQIGPLSLQSIALREGKSEGVLNRIEQLREKGISIVNSTYFRLVLQLAKIKDDELLHDLLHSDFHPDVFDDSELQARLIVSTAQAEDWQAHRLLLTSRLVKLGESSREAANALAHIYVFRKDRYGLSKLLTDMKSMEVPVNQSLTNFVFDGLVNEAKSTFLPEDSLYFYLSICRQLASMEIPVPIRCWRKILFCLARQDRLDDLEKICPELVDMFIRFQSSRPGFVPLHPDDIPDPIKKHLSAVNNLLGVYVPLDISMQSPLHPLRQIFDDKLVGTIVRYGFYSSPDKQSRVAPSLQIYPREPARYNGARVVRLLRVLRDRGLLVNEAHLASLVKLRLVTLYGPGYPTKRVLQIAKAGNKLPLIAMKSLVDEAWGEEFLPPLEKLQEEIKTRGLKEMKKNMKYLESVGKIRPQLHSLS
ncbi:hypothetical protein F4804DRAFT_55622 [Jackrogersella minutella]|nr:hypothetical protein F4804DRAFT_55622 [Jackrogersella minutella]